MGLCAFNELKIAVVGIAGLGGLGSNVAEALVRLGVGKLIIADFDVVEAGNLNRQNYFLDQVGCGKTDACIENLARISAETEIVGQTIRLTAENIPQVFAGADVVAECFDRADQKRMLVETVLSKMPQTAVVTVSGLAGYGRSNEIRTSQLGPRLAMIGDQISEAAPGVPLTAGRVGVAAYHQANAIAEILIDGKKIQGF